MAVQHGICQVMAEAHSSSWAAYLAYYDFDSDVELGLGLPLDQISFVTAIKVNTHTHILEEVHPPSPNSPGPSRPCSRPVQKESLGLVSGTSVPRQSAGRLYMYKEQSLQISRSRAVCIMMGCASMQCQYLF